MAYDLWLDAFEDGCAELVRMVPDERSGLAQRRRGRGRAACRPHR
jgi:hypothetical protein